MIPRPTTLEDKRVQQSNPTSTGFFPESYFKSNQGKSNEKVCNPTTKCLPQCCHETYSVTGLEAKPWQLKRPQKRLLENSAQDCRAEVRTPNYSEQTSLDKCCSGPGTSDPDPFPLEGAADRVSVPASDTRWRGGAGAGWGVPRGEAGRPGVGSPRHMASLRARPPAGRPLPDASPGGRPAGAGTWAQTRGPAPNPGLPDPSP